MAEVVLRHRVEAAGLADQVVVDSAGVCDEERGNPIDRRAARVLAARGYPVPVRRARQVRAEELAGDDLVLAMTSAHARALRRMAGTAGVAARLRLYRTFDPSAPRLPEGGPEHLLDVVDPWYGGMADFEACLDQVEAAAGGIVGHVRAELAAAERA